MLEELGCENTLYINKYLLFTGRRHVQIRVYIAIGFNARVNIATCHFLSWICASLKTVRKEWQRSTEVWRKAIRAEKKKEKIKTVLKDNILPPIRGSVWEDVKRFRK